MSEPEDYANRRNFSRIPKEAAIEVAKLEYPVKQQGEQWATLRNITQDGICCTVPIAYTIGTVLNLKIALKGWNQYRRGVRAIIDTTVAKAPLSVIGEVVWCKAADAGGYEIGVRLTNVYEDDKIALMRYLDTLCEI